MLRASETSGQGVERLLSHLTGLRARQLNGLCLHAEIGSGLFPLNLFFQLEEAVIPGPQFHVEPGTGRLISVLLIRDS